MAGQSINCRANVLIVQRLGSGDLLHLWEQETEDPVMLEQVGGSIRPPWKIRYPAIPRSTGGEKTHRVVVTKHGRPAAVMPSVDDLASLEESLEIMGKPRLVGQIRDSLAELAQVQAGVLTKEQVLELLRQ